jgi:hypothetical protein
VGRRRRTHEAAEASTGLQLCLFCGSCFVVPVESRDAGGGAQWLLLRCGECGTLRQAIAPPGAAEAFDRALEAGVKAISETLERLDRERMAAQAEAFIAALHRDLIDARDFRERRPGQRARRAR